MKEHRRGPRKPTKLACEIAADGRRARGCVRDVSAAGLSVRSDLDCSEGDAVRVRIELPRGAPIDVDAIVWHVRRIRRRKTGDTAVVLGLVLSEPPDGWFDRIGAPRPDAGAKRDAGADEPAPGPSPARPATPTRLTAFLVRLKEAASSRTRAYRIEAESPDDARALAIARAGATWNVLETLDL